MEQDWLKDRHAYQKILVFPIIFMKSTSSRKNNKLPRILTVPACRRSRCKLGLWQEAFCLCCHKGLYVIRNNYVLLSLSRHLCFLMSKLPFVPASLQYELCQ